MSSYKQLNYAQRCQAEVLNKCGFSQQSIGDADCFSAVSLQNRNNTLTERWGDVKPPPHTLRSLVIRY